MALLVADIGGTHGRFGLVEEGALRPRDVGVEEGDAHQTLEGAVAAYLDKVGSRPAEAAFAVAGSVDGRRARITNRPSWKVDADALARRFGFERVALMNDFAAQAACLPHLDPSEIVAVGDTPPREGVKAAVGPGTGLGVAALLPEGDGWRPLPGEGGHVELAAVTPREAAAFEIVRRASGRVSAEDILSGPGLARLHGALAAVDGRAEPRLEPREIAARAGAGEERAVGTVRMFLAALARFSGDVALTFGAQGGVHLCGGIAPKLLGLIDAVAFRAGFEAKAPHDDMMRAIPTCVVVSPVAGLIGCAAAVRRSRAIANIRAPE